MINRIQYGIRIFLSGICYATFGIGALGLFLGIFPIIDITSFSAKTRRRRLKKAVSLSFRYFIWQLTVLGGIQVTIPELDKLKAAKNVVLIANHPTLLDVVILLGLLPQADCIVKGKLLQNPYFGRVIKKVYIPNTGDTDTLMTQCNQTLEDGNALLIFPEGTRTTPGVEPKLSRGAANIALRTQHDVLPLQIDCYPSGISKTVKWYSVPKEKMCYTISVCDKIKIDPYLTDDSELSRAARQLTADMKAILFS